MAQAAAQGKWPLCGRNKLLTVTCIEPTDDVRWQALISAHPAGVFHSPPWFQVLADTYGFEVKAYVTTDAKGSPLAGLAFCQITDTLGSRLISLPFSDACDPLAVSQACWEAILARLRMHGLPIHLRCLGKHLVPADACFTIVKRARWHILPVDISPESLWSGLSGPTRRAIRKARQSGVEIRSLMDSKDLRGFYELHVALRKHKYRLLAQPPAFFESLAYRFGKVNGWFPLGAYLKNRLIAATIYLRWGDTLYYKFNASDRDALKARPNNLLIWEGISLARSLGCRRMDLGPSDEDQPGLIRFKRHFGAEEKELLFIRYTPPGWRDECEIEVRHLLGSLTKIFTAPGVSDDLSSRAGTLFYRYFA